jgi:hypothetical protein
MNIKLLKLLIRKAVKTEDKKKKEEDEATRLVRPAPTKKPPRRDKTRTIMKDSDPDLSKKDPDMSLNFKDVGGSLKKKSNGEIEAPNKDRDSFAVEIDDKRFYFRTKEEAETFLEENEPDEDDKPKKKPRPSQDEGGDDGDKDTKIEQKVRTDSDIRKFKNEAEEDYKYTRQEQALDNQERQVDPEWQVMPEPLSKMLNDPDFDLESLKPDELKENFRNLSPEQMDMIEMNLSNSKLTMLDMANPELAINDKKTKILQTIEKSIRDVKKETLPTFNTSKDLDAYIEENPDNINLIARKLRTFKADELVDFIDKVNSQEALNVVKKELSSRTLSSFKHSNIFLSNLQKESIINPSDYDLADPKDVKALVDTFKNFSDADLAMALKDTPSYQYVLDFDPNDYKDVDIDPDQTLFDPKRKQAFFDKLLEDLQRDSLRREFLKGPGNSYVVKDNSVDELLSSSKAKKLSESIWDLLFKPLTKKKSFTDIMNKKSEYRGKPGPLFFYDVEEGSEGEILDIERPEGLVPYKNPYKPSRRSRDLSYSDFKAILKGAYLVATQEPACVGVPNATAARIALDLVIWDSPSNYQANVDAPTYKALYDLLYILLFDEEPSVSENIGQTL